MREQSSREDIEPTITIGPFTFSDNMIMMLVGAYSLLAYVIASMVGVVPGTATTLAEALASMHVIWAALVLCFSIPLAYACKKSGHPFYGQILTLMGVGLLAGTLLTIAL